MSGVDSSVSPMPAMVITRSFIRSGAGPRDGPSRLRPGAAEEFQEIRRRFSGHDRKDDDFAAVLLDHAAFVLIEGFQRVISAFHVDVRLGRGEKTLRGAVVENADSADALECGDDGGAVVLMIDRPAGT